MLMNAKDKNLSQTTYGLPQVGQAVGAFLQPVTFEYMQTTIFEGRTQYVPICVKTQACKQPFSPQMLKIKPEADRAWAWYWIHSLTELEVEINDRITFNGQPFKVMAKLNFKEYGYFEYHVIEDTV